ncbi:hypothetical protein ABZ468_48505, partial [Streptomyces sp. NPDC005708]|uniref:hypothetical protein n=1 Tax=Streptomyces sp. NPDC005708 TaxID=3154564 RepID=UPI0033C40841
RATDTTRGLDRRLPDLPPRHTSTNTDLTKPYYDLLIQLLGLAYLSLQKGQRVTLGGLTW